jgi:hypothetical protein
MSHECDPREPPDRAASASVSRVRWLVVASVAAAACTSPHRPASEDAARATTDSTDPPCPDSAKTIYTIDSDGTLFTFDASARSFHILGRPACAGAMNAFSMSVARSGEAYVLDDGGRLYKVDLATLMCMPTPWLGLGFTAFGMAFATDTIGGTNDRLYIAGSNPLTLASVDLTTFTPTSIGTLMGASLPELTGNQNAELWALFPNEDMPKLVKLDRATAAAVQTFAEPDLKNASDYAVASWGGSLWAFVARDKQHPTIVYQLDPTTGAIVGMTPTTDRFVVGAGVSTCAPVIP